MSILLLRNKGKNGFRVETIGTSPMERPNLIRANQPARARSEFERTHSIDGEAS
jgi:hypothetical protein